LIGFGSSSDEIRIGLGIIRLDNMVKKPSNFDVGACGYASCRRFNSFASNDLLPYWQMS
jgi:hypothetical protein